MYQLLASYLQKSPEIVFEWSDPNSEAKGWLVINSLKGGAAGGGTRMRKGLTKDEVVSLAKVMEVKFSVCGPAIGGAKSGISFDPQDPRKNEVLRRWFEAISPILKSYYGTGGDLNVDEVKDVFPITESLGIIHPQEGVLSGHFKYDYNKKQIILNQLDLGCKMPVKSDQFSPDHGEGKFNVADMITGYGVAESVKHYYHIVKEEDLKGKTVLIQGWGNVASAAGFYLAKLGAKIVAITDRNGGVFNREGFSFEEVRNLFLSKNGNELQSDHIIDHEEVQRKVWNYGAEIFIPAAASRIVSIENIKSLIASGTKLISCGANVPFIEDQIIFGDCSQYADEHIGLIPDFIANCGMARAFNFLMQPNQELSEEHIFQDVSNTIYNAMRLIEGNAKSPNRITARALQEFIQ